jgi:hypothetical protein
LAHRDLKATAETQGHEDRQVPRDHQESRDCRVNRDQADLLDHKEKSDRQVPRGQRGRKASQVSVLNQGF